MPAGDAPPGVAIEELPDATLLLDDAGLVVDLNTAARRLLGPAWRGALGRTLADGLGATDRDGRPVGAEGWGAAARLRSVRAIPEQPVVLHLPGGQRTVLAAAGLRRGPDGRVRGAVVALRDAAARRRRQAAAGIEVVATVSHELRSPLTSVKGFTSLLLNRWDRIGDDDKRMMLGQIQHDADRVTRLITELLDISRLESGRLVLRPVPLDVPALAARVVARLALEHPGLDPVTRWAPDLPRAWADPDKVEQVLTNLLENACKYASPVGVTLSGGVEDDRLWVAVADRGGGIAPEDLDRVFTRFFRREDGRPSGSGLGLWISRGLVEAHGGTMTVESTLGAGSTFRFTLPLSPTEEP